MLKMQTTPLISNGINKLCSHMSNLVFRNLVCLLHWVMVRRVFHQQVNQQVLGVRLQVLVQQVSALWVHWRREVICNVSPYKH
ncbi:hypothetical protein CA831_29290 [Burkholderia multivorans]|nr:hypothetical protein CA831_29290 [Burkholderia multivorans]